MTASATGWPSGVWGMRSPSDGNRRVGYLRTGFRLVSKQLALDLDAPTVTTERAVAPYHPMTRHEQRRRVARARLRRRADRRGPAGRRGERGVAQRCAGRHLPERGPGRGQERPTGLLDRDLIDRGEIPLEIRMHGLGDPVQVRVPLRLFRGYQQSARVRGEARREYRLLARQDRERSDGCG